MTGWRKRRVSEMAKEAGLRDWTCNGKYGCLEAFADLVRADEREKILDMCKEGLWDGEGIRHHLNRGQA